MKFFVVIACALAVATGHVITPTVYSGHVHSGHVVAGHANVVSHAYPAVATTYAAAPVVAAATHVVAAAPVYSGPQHLPVIGANGVPVDTPAVQEAKAVHFAKKAEAHARNGDYAVHAYAPAVATYAAAPAVATTYAAAPVVAAAQPIYTGPQHLPVIGANGVPVDTPAVQNAKAAHFAQKAEAHARNGDWAVQTPIVAAVPAVAATYAAAPVVAAAQPVYTGPQHLPVIGANGVPVDTPAVQQAKASHFAQKAEAHARNGDWAVAQQVATPVVAARVATPVVATTYAQSAPVVASTYSTSYSAPVVASTYSHSYAPAVATSYSTYSAPVVASTYAHAAPVVASTYAHAAPVVASTYAHAAPVVASTYSAVPVVAAQQEWNAWN